MYDLLFYMNTLPMKFQFLPHYVKYIAIVLFLFSGLGVFGIPFWEGLNGLPEGSLQDSFPQIFFSKTFEVLALLSVLLFALSREKVFDEFLLLIRINSMQIVFWGTLIFILLRKIFLKDWELPASYLFTIQVLGFLLVYYVSKSVISFSSSSPT